jgi:hypothetical protein
MSRPTSRLLSVKLAASGFITWLAAPLVVHAASFDEIFNHLPVAPAPDKQSAITRLFNNRVYVWGLYAVSVAAIFSIFYAAYLYVTAQGSAEQAEKSKRALIYAILGILVLGFMIMIMTASRNIGAGIATNNVGGTL